jgi:hypothetical protein
VALVVPGRLSLGVFTEYREQSYEGDEVKDALDMLAHHEVYCDAPLSRMRWTTDARLWEARTWHDQLTQMRFNNTSVHATRGCLADSDDPFSDLLAFMAFCRRRHVNPASISTMGWNLWRSTLAEPLFLESDPEVTTPALYGGRQQARPLHYRRAMTLYDMEAAYPTAMTEAPLCSQLREENASPELLLPIDGIADATVRVPKDLAFGPLPYRVDFGTLYDGILIWPKDEMKGRWPLRELYACSQLGCDVTLHRVWRGVGQVQPFDGWWKLLRRARGLPQGAGHLGKLASNLLWGQFAMSGSRASWTWLEASGTDYAHLRAREPVHRLPHAQTRHLSVEICSRVRYHLLTEALYGPGIPAPVHIDTDGIVVRSDAPCPQGNWRPKRKMASIEVRGPQLYRYTCGHGCGITHARWHYVCSGIPAADAAVWWESQVPDLDTLERDSDQVKVMMTRYMGEEVQPSPWQITRWRAAEEAWRIRQILTPEEMFVEEER